ncbi:MAG: hypothetical protein K6E76_04215 [Patescibacteria group bacterium]|nr:hypothetical protein [Patescibacteria group bacterium]
MADTLKEKIDTNKNQNLEIKELQAFINNPKNLQELADHLNQNMFL